MLHKALLFSAFILLILFDLTPSQAQARRSSIPAPQTTTGLQPVVAIHVSELTKALTAIPAQPPTPMGEGNTGFQWFYKSWRYDVLYESLEEALRSDGTPFVEVSDQDIAAGRLLNSDSTPHYPILFSLASEAISDDEIVPLRQYVAAGGFLFVGSSSFTRYPSGATRGDFAIGKEMGVHMVKQEVTNWIKNNRFTRQKNQRLVSAIPEGTLIWNMQESADQIPQDSLEETTIHFYNQEFKIRVTDALVIAKGEEFPILTTKGYQRGRFIYYSPFQPLIGHDGYNPSLYAYLIFRNAIEWAFQSSALPIIRLSPWQYQYDAAMIIRHDFEQDPGKIQSIGASAHYESWLGVRGDYYFCTGMLRPGTGDLAFTNPQRSSIVSSLRQAVQFDRATIGSHNGGLPTPNSPLPIDLRWTILAYSLPTPSPYIEKALSFNWHWGPDEVLDFTIPGYPSGLTYANTSIAGSFSDIEGWLAGLDNGRAGCGVHANCPRLWVSPNFNSSREKSFQILEQLGVQTAGEQKISPFPHWTLSTTSPGKHYRFVSLPVSDWFVGERIAQSIEEHTELSLKEAVDFYYDLGALLNFYSHLPAMEGNKVDSYIHYGLSKPYMWATNAVGIYDWWVIRSGISMTPTFTKRDGINIIRVTLAGSNDPEAAIEVTIPGLKAPDETNLRIFYNGRPAEGKNYRITRYGIKIKIGTTTTSLEIRYTD